MRVILLFLAVFLFANEKLIIAQFENLKPYYYNHQIVNLKLKIITAKDGNLTISDDKNLTYNYHKEGIDLISNLKFKLKDKYPIFNIKFQDNNITDEVNLTINSQIKQLYPPKNFCNIIADDLKITDKMLTKYNDKFNIVYWTIIAKHGDAKDFRLYPQEKLYFLDINDTYSKYAYSALVPINQRDFQFKYFNLNSESYKTISFHIDLKNETISTQTDIKPMDKNRIYIIDSILGILLILWGLLYFYKRKWIYIVLIVIVIVILVVLNLPKKQITLPSNTAVHILPFDNSTIFYVVDTPIKAKVLKTHNNWEKVEFNKRIGWIKDE